MVEEEEMRKRRKGHDVSLLYCFIPHTSILTPFPQTATTHQAREKASLEEESANLRRQTEEGSRQTTDLSQRLHSQAALIASLQDQVVGLQSALQQSHDQLGMQGKESDEIK